jgi:hypothetical protein
MDTTHTRLSLEEDHLVDHLRHAVVGAAVALLIAIALLAVREIRFAPRPFASAVEAVTSGVPSEVVSVATLVLGDDRQVRVGDAKADTIASLASQTLVKRSDERGAFGSREIRTYGGFTLVFEPFTRTGEPRVAAIYVQ